MVKSCTLFEYLNTKIKQRSKQNESSFQNNDYDTLPFLFVKKGLKVRFRVKI